MPGLGNAEQRMIARSVQDRKAGHKSAEDRCSRFLMLISCLGKLPALFGRSPMVGRRRPSIGFALRESLEQAQGRFEQPGESPGKQPVYIEIVA